jgi:hypothetical protein
MRAVIAAVFALPPTFAGYHVVLAIAQIRVPSLGVRSSCFGKGLHRRHGMDIIFTEFCSLEQGRAVGDSPQPIFTSGTRER